MSQNITLLGASYTAVPAVLLPKTGGGTATFTDVSDTTAVAADVASGKVLHAADGSQITGSVTERTASDLVLMGQPLGVAAPAGIYRTQAIKTIPIVTGSATATKGSVSNNSISVTPKWVTSTAGWMSGTKTGTAVSVSASELVSGTKSITSNGSGIDVTNYASVDVSVSGGGSDAPCFAITTDGQGYDAAHIVSITCDKTFAECWDYAVTDSIRLDASAVLNETDRYALNCCPGQTDGLEYIVYDLEVPILLIEYDSNGITWDDYPYVDSLNVSGATVTAPYGYYANDVSATVASGTAGTPSATKGAVSNHAISVTPSVTNTAGYISGGTKTGTAVTVQASELVSGSETKTSNGTYDVTNLAELVVNVSGGGSGLTKLATKNLGALSTSATTATDTGQTITVTGVDAYDMLVCIAHTTTHVNGRHLGTVSVLMFAGQTTATTNNAVSIATLKQNYKAGSNGTVTKYTGTTSHGVYAYTPTQPQNGSTTLKIYMRYNSTNTGTINGNYVMDVYGVTLRDLI